MCWLMPNIINSLWAYIYIYITSLKEGLAGSTKMRKIIDDQSELKHIDNHQI